jgi:hypothetical protein
VTHLLARHVEIDFIGTNKCRPVIIDNIGLVCSDDLELGAEREPRPVGRCTVQIAGAEPRAVCIFRSIARVRKGRCSGPAALARPAWACRFARSRRVKTRRRYPGARAWPYLIIGLEATFDVLFALVLGKGTDLLLETEKH